MISLHDFLSCFLVMTLYQSQTIFMFSHHVSRYVFLHVSLYVSLYVSRHDLLSNNLHVFSSWFFIKQSSCFFVMFSLCFSSCSLSWLSIKQSSCFLFMTFYQKDNAKVEKNSIFSSLNVKLEFLMSWVELTQFLVELSRVKLKIDSIWLELN